jgi:hypothetical protein
LIYRRGFLICLYLPKRLGAARTFELQCSSGKAPPAAPLGYHYI